MSFEVILEITFAFLSNTLLLMGIAVVYSIFPVGIKFNTSYRKIIMGLSVSIVGLTVMSANYELGAGLVFDSRTVVLIISGMFLGTIPTTIATVLMSLYRFYIGGAGTFTGILWIVFASTIGLSWRHLRIKRKKVDHNTITWIELYFFHLGSQIIMILLLFTLPNNQGLEVIQQVLIPILVIYPIGGLLISMFMFQQRKKFFKNVNLVRSEEQYKIIFNKSKSMLMLLDSDSGKIIDANEAAIRKYGYTLNEFKNMEPFELNILVKDEILKYYNKAREQDYNDFLFKHRKKDGSIIDVEIHTGPIILDEKHYVFSTLVDVTEAIKVKQEFDDVDEKLKTIFMSVGEGIIVVNEKGYISLVNNKAITLLNTETDIIGKRITNVFRIHSENNTTSFRDSLDYVLQTNNVFNSDSSYSLSPLDDTNSIIYINFNISPLKSKENSNHGAIITIRDITVEKGRQEEIQYISQHDFLTGLHNRYFFEEEMKRLNTERQLPLSIILGDINGLKLLNDSFSHLEGDSLIVEMASILKKAVRAEDIVARWGGDEFVILLPQTSYEDSQKVYDRIKDLCKKSRYTKITPSISLGIATKIEPQQDIFEVLKLSEARMYKEKTIEGKSLRAELLAKIENGLVEKKIESKAHADNMMKLAQEFGVHLQLDNDEIESLVLLARLHDIGKITLSKEILLKTEPLDDIEWQQIKLHSEAGSRIIDNVPEAKHIKKDIMHHHERWDGTGYPHMITEEAIPRLSRIIAIIDAFEVMTSGKAYQDAISIQEAITELENNKGSQFDPLLVDEFIKMIKEQN